MGLRASRDGSGRKSEPKCGVAYFHEVNRAGKLFPRVKFRARKLSAFYNLRNEEADFPFYYGCKRLMICVV